MGYASQLAKLRREKALERDNNDRHQNISSTQSCTTSYRIKSNKLKSVQKTLQNYQISASKNSTSNNNFLADRFNSLNLNTTQSVVSQPRSEKILNTSKIKNKQEQVSKNTKKSQTPSKAEMELAEKHPNIFASILQEKLQRYLD